MSIFDADTEEKILSTGVDGGVYKNSFQKAGRYTAYMTAYNSQGSVNSNWITFYVFGSPPTTASLSINKTESKPGDTITFKSSSNAYYAKIYISIFNNDSLVYSGRIPYDFGYARKKIGTYTAHITAYTHEGSANSNWVTFYVRNASASTSTTATRSGGRIEVLTSITNPPQSAKCVMAVYSSSGELLGQAVNDVNASTNSVTAYLPSYAGASYVKVFLWEDLTSMKPLTSGERVNL